MPIQRRRSERFDLRPETPRAGFKPTTNQLTGFGRDHRRAQRTFANLLRTDRPPGASRSGQRGGPTQPLQWLLQAQLRPSRVQGYYTSFAAERPSPSARECVRCGPSRDSPGRRGMPARELGSTATPGGQRRWPFSCSMASIADRRRSSVNTHPSCGSPPITRNFSL
jgi:hypothetical protein